MGSGLKLCCWQFRAELTAVGTRYDSLNNRRKVENS